MPRTTPSRRAPRLPLAVVTDLDGCLLDARTYSFSPALRTLRRLRRLDVPLVLCTSKTRAEVRALFAALGSRHLAVVEDGCAVLVPPGVAPGMRLPSARRTADGRLLALAPPYAAVRRVVRVLRRRTAGALVGLGDLAPAEVAALTNLPLPAARRAAMREFDEPFVLTRESPRLASLVRRTAQRHGMTVSRGGRFHHLHGPSDKARATRMAMAILEGGRGALAVLALGDSPLDAPFLRQADIAVIVPRPDGRPDPELRRLLPRARIAPAPGPAGWARAVEAVLRGAAPGERHRPRRTAGR